MLTIKGYKEASGNCDFGLRDVLAIFGILALMAFLVVMTTGCGLMSVGVSGNFSGSSGFGTADATIEVLNSTEYVLTITLNGRPQTFEFTDGRVSDQLPPGGSTTFYASNWFGRSGQFMLMVKAWNGSEFVDGDSYTFYIDGYYRQAIPLKVENAANGVRIVNAGGWGSVFR